MQSGPLSSPAKDAGEDVMILVGVIIGAHGIRGEVKLKSFTADPKAVSSYGPLTSATGEIFEITKLKPATTDFIATLKGVTDRNRSEALKGTELFISRAQLPKPSDGEIYMHDLVGTSVYGINDVLLGLIVGFENYGAGDLMDVKIEGRKDTVFIPYTKTFITSATVEKVIVNLPEDYLDEGKRDDV
jgi:16S rRNA processing protein RimM